MAARPHELRGGLAASSKLLAAKGETTVSVVLPARDERETVGEIVSAIRRDLVEGAPLVDEILVVDSRSTDDTAEVAAAAGARVVAQDARAARAADRCPARARRSWKSLHAARGDLVVFVDADLRDFSTSFVTGLLGPLLTDPSVPCYVKACYDRPYVSGAHGRRGRRRPGDRARRAPADQHALADARRRAPAAVGRVRRPPRACSNACRSSPGTAWSSASSIDVLELAGLDAIAQVDLGVRLHRHQSAEEPRPACPVRSCRPPGHALAGRAASSRWSRRRPR